MPLMKTHLEGEGGVDGHWKHLGEELAQWRPRARRSRSPLGGGGGGGSSSKMENSLANQSSTSSDVIFSCRGVALRAHQAVIAPLSPLLANLFKSLMCPHQPQPITVVLDLDPQLVIAFLSLIYRGSANLTRSRVSDLKEVFKMFDFHLPGGFDQSQEAEPTLRASSTNSLNDAANPLPAEVSPLISQHWQPPTSSNSQREIQVSRGPRGRMVTKRGGGISRGEQGHPPPRKRRREELQLEAHLALTNALKDALPGAVAKCTMPGCGEKLSWSDLASHFLAHKKEETSEAANRNGSLTVRGKSPFGPEIKQANQEVLEKLRKVLGDSSSSEEEDEIAESSALVPTARFPSPLSLSSQGGNMTSGGSASPPEAAREEEVKCADCGLSLDFAHQRHHCTAPQPQAECTLCTPSVTFKTVKGRTVHMKISHGYGAPKTPKLASISEKKHGCQICTKTYTEFAKLRTHYTLYHFWERLEEDYSGRGEVCNICSVRFPTHDHLLQHLGNFHCLIDPYLVRKGLRMVSHEKTIRLKSWRCEICQVAQPSAFALKTHLSVKHFYKELKAEFPTASAKERKCPKCYKTYGGSTVAFVIGHIGSIHDEVLKYAANYLDMDATDRSLLPVDDFDDDTVGVPFEKEKTPGGVGNPGALGRGPFDCLVCQICLLQEPNPKALKNHYLGHYREQVMAKVASNGLAQCPFCTNILHNMAEAVTHVTSAHLRQVLLPLMEGDGLWTGQSVVHSKDAFKLHRMDIRLGRLKMPIENSLGYYELPPGDFSDNIQPPSSVPIEKPLTSDTGNESSGKHEDETRSVETAPLERNSISSTIPDTQGSEHPVDIKEEKKEEDKEEENEEEEDGLDIRDKIRNAFGDDSDSD